MKKYSSLIIAIINLILLFAFLFPIFKKNPTEINKVTFQEVYDLTGDNNESQISYHFRVHYKDNTFADCEILPILLFSILFFGFTKMAIKKIN